MAAMSGVLAGQFLCSICSEVFTDPVSTSCGHSFCKTCLNHHWDQSYFYQCPVCGEDFSSRPQLKTNCCLSQIVSQFKKKPQKEAPGPAAEAEGVLCDMCSEPRLQALKSCLVCLASYCHCHLEPHLNNSHLRRHQLINPVDNLEDRICSQHDQPLEVFCKTDQRFMCFQCIDSKHKHDAVPLKRECETKLAELKEMIKERRENIKELQRSVEFSQRNAEREMSEGVKIFIILMNHVQKGLDQFKKKITEEQKNTESRAADLIQELEQELCVLEERGAEMELQSLSEDHFHFLQTFTSEKPDPDVKDWIDETLEPLSYEGLVVTSVSELETTLHSEIQKVFEAELKKVQQFEVDVTLDADTAHPNIVLSDDDKQVSYSNVQQVLPDVPERFSTSLCVLGEQKFSSGRSYFQVQVKGKTAWVLGVAEESVKRKEKLLLCPQRGFWTIRLTFNNQYKANAGPAISLSLRSRPETVGVFVDYLKGVVSFYDVDTAALIYSFTDCGFTEDILPFFGPCTNSDGKNATPLILTPATPQSPLVLQQVRAMEI